MLGEQLSRDHYYDLAALLERSANTSSLLEGLDRGDTRHPSCEKCIGACCLGTRTMDVTAAQLQLLLEKGDLPSIMTFEDTPQGPRISPIVYTAIDVGFTKGNASQGAREVRNDMKVIKTEIIPFLLGELSRFYGPIEPRQFVGSCPALSSNGRCTIYAERPVGCQQYEMGGPSCRKEFIEKGSEAAITLERFLNELQPLLTLLADKLLREGKRERRSYNFATSGFIPTNEIEII